MLALFALVWTLWTVPFYRVVHKTRQRDDAQADGAGQPKLDRRGRKQEKLVCWLQPVGGGALILVSLLTIYAVLPSRGLMLLLALQQVFANVFLQVAVGPPEQPSGASGSDLLSEPSEAEAA